uniref:Uncharacterized protein n=1 Tax=Anopheles dirus TaxID=7168 RepID=A0A182NY11_9DIPT
MMVIVSGSFAPVAARLEPTIGSMWSSNGSSSVTNDRTGNLNTNTTRRHRSLRTVRHRKTITISTAISIPLLYADLEKMCMCASKSQ